MTLNIEEYKVRLKKRPAASGVLIILAATFAMIVENSQWSIHYDAFLNIPVTLRFSDLIIDKPLLFWINDGLMAIFFLLVGLELKREILTGKLSKTTDIILPVVAAVGGIVVPAALFWSFNHDNPSAMEVWAIPTATSIAFSLAILTLLGERVPSALKLFLLSVGIIGDLIILLIIAFIYTTNLSTLSLLMAGSALAILFIMNRMGVKTIAGYILVGFLLWVAVLKSGVHATLAGAAMAIAIPIQTETGELSPLSLMEQDLKHFVGLGILPLFAFANAGISLNGFSLSSVLDPVPLGIAVGLFLGKQLGVFGFVWIIVKSGLAQMPEGLSWQHLYGVALLCGVGFTMSLFISSLAFEHSGWSIISGTADAEIIRLGIFIGSTTSGVLGYLYLHNILPQKNNP
ncbi:MAG: Na+/H+ antiporter NhaA [Magnetococcales bacterium]|nr:Na+/H+ antiporter NhaA [Magnetococcales bacterium]